MVYHNIVSEYPLMTRKEVAALLNVHPGSVKRYQLNGSLPAIHINSRVLRYRREDVDAFLRSAMI
ncbi:MAG: helix-turn-helix domain-containing protein [Verrucomicrobiota bacterium]